MTGGCTAAAGYQAVALWPHLQATGTNVQVTVTHLGVPQTLLDVPYSLGAQEVHLVSAAVQQGDQLRVTCTYVNGTGSMKTFGYEISDEQCFVGVYRSAVMTGATAFECTS